ncbi:cytochrome c-type protein NapC [Pseudomonas aeruginosa]|nr:cytochrome c-type protein NapC [Pseudomonas aeruginosa]
MKALIAWLAGYWRVLRRPSVHFSLGFLTLGGFIAGIVFWGGFNTALEATNTETFCISCHEMRDNVFVELKDTIHYSNRSGVRATCPDCHVPHKWTDKIARKMQASKEVWGKIFGTINTREKFLDHRRELAEHEWARLKANDSLECRNCHNFEFMDFTRQSVRARQMHSTALASGEATCIDCHKGIAHPPAGHDRGEGLVAPPADRAARRNQGWAPFSASRILRPARPSAGVRPRRFCSAWIALRVLVPISPSASPMS